MSLGEILVRFDELMRFDGVSWGLVGHQVTVV